MTDITELAQSLKRRATSSNELGGRLYVKAYDVLALVEALEKAQQRIVELQQGCENDPRIHEIIDLQERIAELESQVKFPGVMRCNTCGFSRSHVIVTPGGMLAGKSEPEHCPNGCGPLWHDTYRRQYNELYDAYKELESSTVTAAAADVLAERQRQVTAEGWTPEHDDEHSDGEMALAASSYALYAHKKPIAPAIPYNWPWEPEWFKQQGARRDLVKAGALILAEIERLDRAAGIKWEAE